MIRVRTTGASQYLPNPTGWNFFDFTIVSISVTELVMSMGLGSSNSGLAAFRFYVPS